ncbi:hypothetical protein AB8841_06305 [Microvirga sp. TS319]
MAPEISLSDAALNSLVDTLDSRFSAPAQRTVTRPEAQTRGESVGVNLDEIEDAMMRDMERTHPKGKPA